MYIYQINIDRRDAANDYVFFVKSVESFGFHF